MRFGINQIMIFVLLIKSRRTAAISIAGALQYDDQSFV